MPFKRERQQLKHYHRYVGCDYSRGAVLFITISTEPRRRVFGDVVDGEIDYNALKWFLRHKLPGALKLYEQDQGPADRLRRVGPGPSA